MDKIKKQITTPIKQNSGIVSPSIKPYQSGTANIQNKLMEKIGILGLLHIRTFGNAHDLLIGKDFTDLLNSKEHNTNHIKSIIELELECDYLFSLLEKIGKVKRLKENETYSYDNDENAHIETYGRWRFVKKELKRHKLNTKK